MERHFNAKSLAERPKKNPCKEALRNYVYGSATANEFLYRKRYREHNDRVIAKILGAQLLIMDIAAGEGWEKLCPFLERDLPALPFAHQNPGGEEDPHYLRLAVDEIEAVIPSGGVLILVDDNAFPADSFSNRRVFSILEQHGRCWGRPANDKSAVEELHRLRRLGATHIVFAWTAFWWLDHYVGPSRYLWSHFPCLFQNDRIIAFDLQRYAKEALLHACTPKGVEV